MDELIKYKLYELRKLYESDEDYYKELILDIEFLISKRKMALWSNECDKKIKNQQSNLK